MKAILLDIEGTTTPIDFVHKTLFPFAKKRIGEYVAAHFDEIEPEIAQLETEHADERKYQTEFDAQSPASVAHYLEFLIDDDRKSTPLKSLQGKIWLSGYESGELESVVFEDVPRAFERWKKDGKTIAIFSSGSVLAQKLIFKFSDAGDLSAFVDAYFDTATGAKREAESYRKIAKALEFQPNEILFVSDIPAELDAAREAGMQTALSVRAGNAPLEEDTSHRIVESFDALE